MKILVANPKAQYLAHKTEIDEAIHTVLDRGRYILGRSVEAFESEFADYVGVGHCVGVGSGTAAIYLALKACDIGQGDEVVTVSHTAVATVAAIELTGAKPVFADICLDTYTLSPKSFENAISPRTRAVIPVHLYGHPAAMEEIIAIADAHRLVVIEDCAQAHGAGIHGQRVGSFGRMGCFSFYPTKNLGALGDGGAVVTNEDNLADKLRKLREYGWEDRFVSRTSGWNSRLDELQAAVLRVKLKNLDQANAARIRIAAVYREGLKGIGLSLPVVREGVHHVFHLYVVRDPRRQELMHHLKEQDIGAGIHYPLPVHRQPAYLHLTRNRLVETDRAVAQILSLPMYPELLDTEVQRVISSVKEFYRTTIL